MHSCAQNACMKQVTIRRVRADWVAKAKREAKRRGVSMNQVLVEALARGLGEDDARIERTNLDKYAGDSDFGRNWDEYLERDLKRIDPELWN